MVEQTCCWCNRPLCFTRNRSDAATKEHLVPKAVKRYAANSHPRMNVHAMRLLVPACRRCNNLRGDRLGPPPTATTDGWATQLWNQGMAHWLVFPITRPKLFQ